MKKIAGIGARTAPHQTLIQAKAIGQRYAEAGWILRSGGAAGMDTAFEQGFDAVAGEKEIFLPWQKYNGNMSSLYHVSKGAYDIIDELFPDGKYRTPAVRALWARNCQQILGENLDDFSDVVICWMKTATPIGGTGRAIKVAQYFGIPWINIRYQLDEALLFLD